MGEQPLRESIVSGNSGPTNTAATMSETADFCDRVRGALLGLLIGDSLAMPVHWYYNRRALYADYGTVRDFTSPHSVHPDSIFWRSQWEAPNPELDILGEQRQFWGIRGVHYHQNLKAGENTLTAKLAMQVWESLYECGGYNRQDYLKRYLALLTHPQRHRDTYIEECHRGFFTNLGRGRKPERCAVTEKHISGLVMMLPVALYYAENEDEGRVRAIEHLEVTHAGDKMRVAAEAILSILYPVLRGVSLAESIRKQCATQCNPHFRFPFSTWIREPDERIIGPKLSSACYVEDAVPAVVYLAAKYHDSAEAGLVSNTNLGGDNVHRGGLLGALLGAQDGVSTWPGRWVQQLVASPELLHER
ncbi:MAG: ADP-ribosylglycohydrolase family protein [Verrucomicrobia bacterium]|nr:ADP-ribosylglycohydrolase family protein [Verrucomicrobiota bacterium]